MFRKLFLLLFFIMTVSICAQIPAYHDVTSKIKSGEIPAPYFLVNSSVIKDRGVDQGWRDENLFDKNNQPDVNRIFGPSRIPSGNWKALVILVQFSDQASSATASSFDGLIFDQSSGTVWDYYKQVSYGALDIVTVNLPSSIGWTSAPQPYSYYVNGQNGFGSYPQNAQKLVEDVVNAADPLVDFSQYDNDGDGNVDALFIVHTGPGAEFTGSSNDIWSHAGVTYNTPYLDGVNITHYSMEPEYWSTPGDMTVGVFCHELGHAAFGLPDVYDRDYSSNGLGDWSLMAGGSWNGSLGSSPAFPDAWNHIQMGYVIPTIVSADVVSQSINDVENSSEIYKLWTNGNPGNEYFLVENRQLTGFDAALPGGGLNIYHVDQNVTTQNDNEWYPGNTSSGHYLVALEQGDGLWDLEQNINRGDAGDSYPGATVNNEFSSASLPNSNDYNSNDTYVGVTNISSSNPTMIADFQVGNSSSLHPTNLSGNVNQANGEVQLNWDYGTPSWDFYEDFEDGVADNWLMSDSRFAVNNGYLKMIGASNNTWASTYYDKIYSDFTFEFEVERIQSDSTLDYSLGASVRANGFMGTGTESGYLINIVASGYYSAWRVDNGAETNLVPWTASPLINTGLNAANVVTINASGPNFDVYINGNFAFSFTDATYSSGFNNLGAYDTDADINEVWWNYASCSIGTLIPLKKDIIPFTENRNYNASPEKTNLPNLHNAYVPPKRLMKLNPAVLDNFNIYRDGVAIGTSTITNFTDNLPAHGTYSYEVTAVDGGVESAPSNLIDLIWAGSPNIVLNKTSLFSTVTTDTVVVDTFVISNTGLADLSYTIDDIETSSPSHLNIKSIEVIKTTQKKKGDSPNDYLKYLNKKIKIFGKASVSWLTESPTSGVIPPGGNNEILVTFNSNGVASGVHNADIIISSNDPDEPTVTVNATLSRNQINLTTDDNEDNALSGNPDYDMDNYLFNDDLIAPIEFNIFINETTINSTQLNIYAWDIDETDGEVDEVYVNGHLIGSLTGANDEWSTTVLPVDPTFIVPGPNGKNLVQVFIDVNGSHNWAVSVDWGQLIINGSTSSDAFIRSVNLSGTSFNFGDNIGITNEIDTDLPSQNVIVETNILDPSNVNVGGTSRTVPISGTNDEPFTENLLIPASGTEGTYNVQVIVYDADTFIQQDIRLVPFEVSANTPSIEVSPTSFSFTVPEGGTDSGVLTISNNGAGDLNWGITSSTLVLRSSENFDKIRVKSLKSTKKVFTKKTMPFKSKLSTKIIKKLNYAPNTTNVLIVKDVNPWDFTSNEDVMNSMGVAYSEITSADMSTLDFSLFDVIIIPSVQTIDFYVEFDNNLPKFDTFIQNGGTLEFHGCDFEGSMWNQLPGGTTHEFYGSYNNYIEDPTHPIVSGLTQDDLVGDWASHDHFLSFPVGTKIITTDEVGLPTTIEYNYGNGLVVATTMTWEYAYNSSWGFAPMLSNAIAYTLEISNSNSSWLSEDPTSGSIPIGSNQTVNIMVDASSLSIGTYNCNLLINSNDPVNSQITIPVTLNVVSGGATDSVSVPDISSNCDSDINIPIKVDTTAGQNIISFQFDLNYDVNSIIPFDASSIIDISGTIVPGSWTVLANTDTLGKVTVAGFSATPLSGSGTLLKLKFHTSTLEGTSNLTLTNFMFNNGTPSVNITNGLLDISCGLCGDADEDGNVYAFDASKTLQAAIGLITLTPQGEVNADVDMGGTVTAFDAALILRHVIGLSEPVATCFAAPMIPEGLSKANGINLEILPLNLDKNKGKTVVEIGLGGITSADNIYSLEMEVELQHGGSLSISGIPSAYVSGINQIDGTHYKVAIIAAKGISTDKIRLKIEYPTAATGTITFNDVKLNDQQTADITSVNIGETLNIKEYKLVGSYPNPFNPSTKIVFEVPQKGIVKIEVYDILGRLVSTLINTEYNQGHYEVTWNGINNSGRILSSGTYIAVMKAGNYQHSIKMNLLK